MKRGRFQEWLSGVDELTAAQRSEALSVLSGRSSGAASVAAVELGVDEERRCPRCDTPGAVSRGRARGLRRYQCKGCGRTFNAVTGTPLSGLHRKDRWLSFGEALATGETVKASAERCCGDGVSLASPVSQGCGDGAGQAQGDCRGGRDVCAGEPQGGTDPQAQGAPPRRQGEQARAVARAGSDTDGRRLPDYPMSAIHTGQFISDEIRVWRGRIDIVALASKGSATQ